MKAMFHDVQWLDANIGAPPSKSSPSSKSSSPAPSSTLSNDGDNTQASAEDNTRKHPDSDSDDDLVYELGTVSIMEYGFEGGRLSTFTPNHDQIGLQVALEVYRTRGHYKEVYFVRIHIAIDVS